MPQQQVSTLLVAVLAITAGAVTSSTESSTAALPEEDKAAYQWNDAAWACVDASASKDDESCGSITQEQAQRAKAETTALDRQLDMKVDSLLGEALPPKVRANVKRALKEAHKEMQHKVANKDAKLAQAVSVLEMVQNAGLPQSQHVKPNLGEDATRQAQAHTVAKVQKAVDRFLTSTKQQGKAPTTNTPKTAARKGGGRPELCHGVTRLCRTNKQGCAGGCDHSGLQNQKKLANFQCLHTSVWHKMCTSSTKCKEGHPSDPDFPNRPCKCYDGTQSWKPFLDAMMQASMRFTFEKIILLADFVYASACITDPCEALHCKRYAKGCDRKYAMHKIRASTWTTSHLCKKPTSTTTIMARTTHSRDLGQATTWGRRRRTSGTRRRRRKRGFFGRMWNKVKKRGVGFLKGTATKVAKKLIFKLINKLPKKVSFLRPVLKDFVSTMLTGPMTRKGVKKRFKKLLPRLGKQLIKAMQTPAFRSFIFHKLDKITGAHTRGSYWYAKDWTKVCFQTFRSMSSPAYVAKVGFKQSWEKANQQQMAELSRHGRINAARVPVDPKTTKVRPGWPKPGKFGKQANALIKAGVCRSRAYCGTTEDHKKGRAVVYIHRILKKDPRNYCEVKFAPWALVCNTCCCKKGFVSSGLETSLSYVRKCAAGANKDKACTVDKDCPGSTCPRVSCKGWYMITLSIANAVAGITQRALIAMRLKSTRCF